MTTPGGAVDAARSAASTLRWWREVAVLAAFYLTYSWVRNRFGSAAVDPQVALDNALLVIDIERAMGLYQEPRIQSWFIGDEQFLRFWNIFYGSLHFIVTPAGLIYLYRRHPVDYPRYRTTGLLTTGFALIGFALFPLMPPRLLGDCGKFGGCVESTYIDTMAEIGGLWSFDNEAVAEISNQYAAMPSLHFAWSYWCFLVFYPRLRRRSLRILIAAYPWLTVFCIVVTANHFWIDALGGAVALASGFAGARIITAFLQRQGIDIGAPEETADPPDDREATAT